jgi:hypothetical protein
MGTLIWIIIFLIFEPWILVARCVINQGKFVSFSLSVLGYIDRRGNRHITESPIHRLPPAIVIYFAVHGVPSS